MGTYILILMIMGRHLDQVTFQEFTGAAACEQAKDIIMKKHSAFTAVCVKKYIPTGG